MATTPFPSKARVARVTVYPWEYFDGLPKDRVWVIPDGRLQDDSQFVLVNGGTREPITLEGSPKILTIRASFDMDLSIVTLRCGDATRTCVLTSSESRRLTERWLSAILGERVGLEEVLAAPPEGETSTGGPTIVSTATLEEVARWVDGTTVEQIRRRARANIELEGVDGEPLPPFWEECLVGPPGEERSFRIADTLFHGLELVRRGRGFAQHPDTGVQNMRMLVKFRQQREQIPVWSPAERFDGTCWLGVRCRVDPSSRPSAFAVGDTLTV